MATPSDSDPAAERFLVEALRRLTPAEKIARLRTLTRSAQAFALVDIRRRHPEADERELRLRLASRQLPAELMVLAFGWDPRREGFLRGAARSEAAGRRAYRRLGRGRPDHGNYTSDVGVWA